MMLAKSHAPDSNGQAFVFWVQSDKQLMRHEVFFWREWHKVGRLVAATQAPRHHMMTLDVPDSLSVSGTLDQCVIVPLVVHNLIFYHFETLGNGVKLWGLEGCARRTPSQA